MALDFGAGDYVDCGSGASVDNLTAMTFCCWGQMPDLATDRNIMQKSHFNTTGWRDAEVTVNERLFFGVNRTTACQARADLTNFSAWPGYDTWAFFAGRVNTGGANGDQRLYVGSLSAPPSEPSSYANQTVGSGSVPGDSTLNLFVGNRNPVSQDRPFGGPMAWFGLWNRVLTPAEINHQWARPTRTQGNVVFLHLGFMWGTGTQRDLSGFGNHGTITGASLADHIPLPGLMVPPPLLTGTPPPVREQEGFLWRDDDGDEDEASALAAQDTDISRSVDTVTRLRTLTDVDSDSPSEGVTLRYNRPGGIPVDVPVGEF